MRTIWKFEIPVTDEVAVTMPRGAEVIEVAHLMVGVLVMWAIVDTDEPEVSRRFSIRGTGHPLGEVGEHLATVQTPGVLVWHCFEAVQR